MPQHYRFVGLALSKQIVSLLIIFSFFCNVQLSGGESSLLFSSISNPKMQLASSLRENGKSFIFSKDYKNAVKCYSAVLQVMEGVGGEESGELRRRCGLTLAECEIKLGNLYQAIARCSEVIEEAPFEYDVKDEGNRQAIGKAYYRRGVSLKRLGKPILALIDFRESQKIFPDDRKVLKEIELIENDLEILKDFQENNIDRYKEDLLDIIDMAQLKYPRINFSNQQINMLADNFSGRQVSNEMNSIDSIMPDSSIDFGSLFGQVGGLGALGSSGAMSLLGSILGIDAKTTEQVTEVFKAIAGAVSVFKKFFRIVSQYKAKLVLFLTMFWILATVYLALR